MKKIPVLIIASIIMLMALGIVSAQLDNHNGFPQYVSSPVQSDVIVTSLDGNGQKDIIVSPNNREIYVFRPDGTLRWKNVSGQLRSDYGRTPAIADLNGDNIQEIITYANPGVHYAHLYIWDANGNMIKDIYVGQDMILTSPVVANAGEKIILVGTSPGYPAPASGATNVYAYDELGNKLWDNNTGPVLRTAPIAVGDIDNDNMDEAAFVVDNNGAGRLVLLKFNTTAAWMFPGDWPKDMPTQISGAVIDDVNNDGNKEIIIGSGSGVYVWNANGALLSSNNIPVVTHSPPAVGDIDGDGIKDIVIGSDQQKQVFALSQGNMMLNMMPGFPVATVQSVWTRLALRDINVDGRLEIFGGDFGGYMYGWNYLGEPLRGLPFKPSTEPFMSSPAISDLENTGRYQILAGNDNRYIYAWEARVPIAPVASIGSPVDGSIIQKDSDVLFSSSSTDEDGTIAGYRWESSIDGIIGNTASFNKVLSPGWHDITLTVTDNEGLSNSAGIRIKVNKPPTAIIESPATGAIFKQNDAVSFVGQGLDDDGAITSYQWSSDFDENIGTTSSFSYSSLSPGVHNITLTVTDDDGASGNQTININQTGYDLQWLLKVGADGNLSDYKLGNNVPIKFSVHENGSFVVDRSVVFLIFDPNGNEVLRAIYGTRSDNVKIDETGRVYSLNFRSRTTDPSGRYKLQVLFDNIRNNQEFSNYINILYQVSANFVNQPVTVGGNGGGSSGTTFVWTLNGKVISREEKLKWVPDAPGIYDLKFASFKGKGQIDVESYKIFVNAEADANGDDIVDDLDLEVIGLSWGRTQKDNDFDNSADVNGDGIVDILDAVKVGKKWS